MNRLFLSKFIRKNSIFGKCYVVLLQYDRDKFYRGTCNLRVEV